MQITNNQSYEIQSYFMELQNNNKTKYILCIGIKHMQMKKNPKLFSGLQILRPSINQTYQNRKLTKQKKGKLKQQKYRK